MSAEKITLHEIITKNLNEYDCLKSKDKQKIVSDIVDDIRNTLLDGNDLNIYRFGTFRVHDTKECIRFSPYTKERIQVPPRKRVSFRTSQIFKKELINTINNAK